MSELIEKIEKSELFPENVKKMLIEEIDNNNLPKDIIKEIETMLEEEDNAIKKIEKDKEDKIKSLNKE